MVIRAQGAFMSRELVGTVETVKQKLIDMIDGTEMDGVMIIFDDYEAGLHKFGQYILPTLRAHYG